MQDTWDAASNRWLNARRDNKWFAKDEGRVRTLSEHLAGFRLKDISAAKVSEVREALLADRGPATVNRLMGVLSTILNVAREEWQMVDATPRVKRLKEDKRARFLTREEAANLLAALPRRIKPLVQFALATGLRQSNILNLEWTEVDIQRRALAIPGSKMKNGDPFGAPLNEAAISVLVRQKGKHPRWVFPVKHGGTFGPLKGISNRMWKRACAEAGIEDFKFHDLRHTWASWHLQAGTHPHALRELGGWKDDSMMKRYAHLAIEHLADAAKNVGELCLPSTQKKSRTTLGSAPSKPDG